MIRRTHRIDEAQGAQRQAHTIGDIGRRGFGTGRAHGKVILLGEHAVVYGAPALALAVPALSCRIQVTPVTGNGRDASVLRFMAATRDEPSATPDGNPPEGLRLLIEAMADAAGLRTIPGLDVLVESEIPSGRGLGSSAAYARALVHALAELWGLRPGPEAVFDFVQISEDSAHGRSSGIDALATGTSGPVLLADGRAVAPAVGRECWIVVADSGTGASTKAAVAMLRHGFDTHPGSREAFLDRSAALTGDALRAFREGRLEILGQRFTDCHTMLAGLRLTTPGVDTLVNAAVACGALGAKMSGGGLGGCVIALTATAPAAEALAERLGREHGARSWTVRVPQGAGDGLR